MQEVRGSNPLSSTSFVAALVTYGVCCCACGAPVKLHASPMKSDSLCFAVFQESSEITVGSAQSRRKVRERSRPGRLEGVGSLSVAALEEVPVHVVGGAYRGVTEPLGDDVGVLSGRDQQGHVGVSEIMRPHRRAHRCLHSRIPDPLPEQAEPERTPFGGGEDQTILSRICGQVGGELVGEEGREAHGPASGSRLERFFDSELTTKQVEAIHT